MIHTAEEIKELFRDYATMRSRWMYNVGLDREYRYGRQYDDIEVAKLELTGRGPAPDNRIHPAVEMGKALLTANAPRFKAVPVEGTDIKSAKIGDSLLAYHWRISDGSLNLREIVDEYYVAGAGFSFTYIDPNADDGRGEVKYECLSADDVYVDPYSRHRLNDDAECIMISREYTRYQAERMLRKYKAMIKSAGGWSTGDSEGQLPQTQGADYGELHYPGDIQLSGRRSEDGLVRVIRAFFKDDVPVVYLHQKWDAGEACLHGEEIKRKYSETMHIVQGVPVKSERYATELYEGLLQMYEQLTQQYEQAVQMFNQGQAEDPGDPPSPPTFKMVKYYDLIQEGLVEVVKGETQRVVEYVVIGDQLAYKKVLPISNFPVVPYYNMHTRTPYPMSDVRLARPLQDRLNALDLAILTHAQNSATLKVIYNSASVDKEDFNLQWKSPGVGIGIDMEDGVPPIIVQPAPLSGEVYLSKNMIAQAIDHQFGLYRLMMGDSSVAPETNSATLNVDQFGQRKSRSKLADIEASLCRAGEIAFQLMQSLYTIEKTVRIVDKNMNISEYMINVADENGREIESIGDISTLKFDIAIVPGSTMPDNPTAELGKYLQLFEKQAVDRTELWKHMGEVDVESLSKRFSEIEQLSARNAQLEEEIKKMQGDAQTRDREIRHLLDTNETTKLKADLTQIKSVVQANATVATARMTDAVSAVTGAVKQTEKERTDGTGSGGRKRRR